MNRCGTGRHGFLSGLESRSKSVAAGASRRASGILSSRARLEVGSNVYAKISRMNGRRSNSGKVSAMVSFFFVSANTPKETQAAKGSKT
jgi:hypothetical protein